MLGFEVIIVHSSLALSQVAFTHKITKSPSQLRLSTHWQSRITFRDEDEQAVGLAGTPVGWTPGEPAHRSAQASLHQTAPQQWN